MAGRPLLKRRQQESPGGYTTTTPAVTAGPRTDAKVCTNGIAQQGRPATPAADRRLHPPSRHHGDKNGRRGRATRPPVGSRDGLGDAEFGRAPACGPRRRRHAQRAAAAKSAYAAPRRRPPERPRRGGPAPPTCRGPVTRGAVTAPPECHQQRMAAACRGRPLTVPPPRTLSGAAVRPGASDVARATRQRGQRPTALVRQQAGIAYGAITISPKVPRLEVFRKFFFRVRPFVEKFDLSGRSTAPTPSRSARRRWPRRRCRRQRRHCRRPRRVPARSALYTRGTKASSPARTTKPTAAVATLRMCRSCGIYRSLSLFGCGFSWSSFSGACVLLVSRTYVKSVGHVLEH